MVNLPIQEYTFNYSSTDILESNIINRLEDGKENNETQKFFREIF